MRGARAKVLRRIAWPGDAAILRAAGRRYLRVRVRARRSKRHPSGEASMVRLDPRGDGRAYYQRLKRADRRG